MSGSVLVTGASGYIGHLLVERLAEEPALLGRIVATDVRPVAEEQTIEGVDYRVCDVRDPSIADVMRDCGADTVVHLAAIVSPGKGSTADMEYSVDVLGTRNVLEACVAAGVRKLIYTSSGAAYGYWADNPEWLRESDELRGNDSFPYSRHKRLVEEDLARYRQSHPGLAQLVFRPGTILGESVSNQITAMFEKPWVLGMAGSVTPFVFIWDRDVVECLALGVRDDKQGIYNLAGDGVVSLREIAERLKKPYVRVPAGLVKALLAVLKPVGLSRYGPEQVDFLRYRPVLANEKLKAEFGYTPRMTSSEVFDLYCSGLARHGG